MNDRFKVFLPTPFSALTTPFSALKSFPNVQAVKTLHLWLLAIVVTARLGAEISDERKEELLEPYLQEKPINVHRLTEEERLYLLDVLRRRRAEIGEANEAALFDLGDEEWTKTFIRVWNMGNKSQSEEIARAGRPNIIPLIIPSLLKEEAYFHEYTDVEIRPHSVLTAGLIKAIVARSPAFSEETINWVQGLLPQSDADDQEFREIMREWWKENKPLFDAKDYKAVRPGRNLSSATESAAAPLEESPTAVPPVSIPESPKMAPVATQPSSPSSGLLWAVAVATVTLLAVLLFFWKRRA